jgi:predicted nucleic acid-binding protein
MGKLSALAGQRVYLDANVFIYALEDVPEWGKIAARVLSAIDTGECSGVTSELTPGECLVKPQARKRQDIVQAYLDVIRNRPFFTAVPVTRNLLIEAARVSGTTGLKLPDATHVATALSTGCSALLTNDAHLIKVHPLRVMLISTLLES